jgi:hypothetical protein
VEFRQRLEVYDGRDKGCSNRPLVIVCFLALRASPPQRSALLACALSVGRTYHNTVLPGDACAPRPFSGGARTSDRLSPRAAISERERVRPRRAMTPRTTFVISIDLGSDARNVSAGATGSARVPEAREESSSFSYRSLSYRHRGPLTVFCVHRTRCDRPRNPNLYLRPQKIRNAAHGRGMRSSSETNILETTPHLPRAPPPKKTHPPKTLTHRTPDRDRDPTTW